MTSAVRLNSSMPTTRAKYPAVTQSSVPVCIAHDR